jgi:outer membrane protein assembly factor BamE
MIARNPTRFLRAALAATAVAVAVAGCTSDKWGFPYKAPVQQGNWITQEQIALLQPGMTREQVRFALGSPTLTSVLHADRWDYPYYFKPGYGAPQERKFTVWFDHDVLVRWDGDKQPELQPFQLNAEGTPQQAVDETIDAETARQNAQVPPQSTMPSDAAQLPALGTPPGGALPAGQEGAGSGVRAPSMSESDQNPAQPSSGRVRQRELLLNAPTQGADNAANPAFNGAEPLR